MYDWEMLRDQFPITARWAFFDHAAVAPISLPAQQAITEYAHDLAENGVVTEPAWIRRVENVRALAGRLIQSDPMDIAFIKNTSEGISFVAEGYPWRSGDNLIISEEEYPSNVYPWMHLSTKGVEVRRVATRDRRICVDDIRDLMNARTRLVSLSFVEFASGFRNDLDAVGNLCRERGVHFFVDAIQGLGVLPLNVRRTPIDFLSADGHKWLLGPDGAGVFYVRRSLVEILRPVSIGWNSVIGARNFSKIDFRLKPHAGRWESGSMNVAGITALGASMKLLLDIGIEQVSERVIALTDYLCERLAAIGLEVYSSRLPGDRSGIVSVLVPTRSPSEIVRACRQQGIVVNHRAGRLRLSPHCYNTTEELDRVLKILQ